MLEPVSHSDDILVSWFSERSDCLEQLLEKPCEVLIVDLEDNELEGLAMLVRTRRKAPWLSTLAFVSNGAVASAVRAVKAGACECLEKPVDPDRLVKTIEDMLARAVSLPRSHRTLTHMEIQILQLILAGRTSQGIGVHLHRSKRTIDVHRKNIMRKLQASSLVDLVRRALALGLTDESDSTDAGSGVDKPPSKGT